MRRQVYGVGSTGRPMAGAGFRWRCAACQRIDAAAQRYGCAAGMVARYAIEHGMRGALQRLQRELPPDQRPSAATEATETAERG